MSNKILKNDEPNNILDKSNNLDDSQLESSLSSLDESKSLNKAQDLNTDISPINKKTIKKRGGYKECPVCGKNIHGIKKLDIHMKEHENEVMESTPKLITKVDKNTKPPQKKVTPNKLPKS